MLGRLIKSYSIFQTKITSHPPPSLEIREQKNAVFFFAGVVIVVVIVGGGGGGVV